MRSAARRSLPAPASSAVSSPRTRRTSATQRDPQRTGRDRAAPAAHRLGQLQHRPRDDERGNRENDERQSPRQRGDVAGHREADPRAEQLAGEHVAVDPATLGAGEPVPEHRRHHRAGRGGRDAEKQPGDQQVVERARGRAPDHARAPEHDRQPEGRRTPHPVREHPERDARDRGDDRVDPDQQPDVGVVDVQGMPQDGRRSADRRAVGTRQRPHRAEHQNHPGPGRAAEGVLDLAGAMTGHAGGQARDDRAATSVAAHRPDHARIHRRQTTV